MSLRRLLSSYPSKGGSIDAVMDVGAVPPILKAAEAYDTIQKRKRSIHKGLLDESQARYQQVLSALNKDIISSNGSTTTTKDYKEILISFDEFMAYNKKIFNDKDDMV